MPRLNDGHNASALLVCDVLVFSPRSPLGAAALPGALRPMSLAIIDLRLLDGGGDRHHD